MTVFQHASVVPTSEIVGRELQGRTWRGGGGGGGGGPGRPVPPPPPLWEIVFCPYNAGGENARIRRISTLPLTERHCDG